MRSDQYAEIQLDFERRSRTGLDESIYGEGKSIAQLDAIFESAANRQRALLVTRLRPEKFASLTDRWAGQLDYCATSETAFFGKVEIGNTTPRVAVVAAGSSDVRVAREVERTLAFEGVASQMILDVGVAGLWRLTRRIEEIGMFPIVIAIAGMDAALPTVLGGLISSVIIAVPTSVGYGVATGGHTALHAILASCAPGITTVNIDNGYGAACAAIRALGANHKILIQETNQWNAEISSKLARESL